MQLFIVNDDDDDNDDVNHGDNCDDGDDDVGINDDGIDN